MLGLLRWLVILMLGTATAVHAPDLPNPWVEFASDGGLEIRAVTAPGMPCPKVVADGVALPSKTRGQPDAADGAFPVQLCVAHATASVRRLTADGLPLPVLPTNIQRSIVIGDTR